MGVGGWYTGQGEHETRLDCLHGNALLSMVTSRSLEEREGKGGGLGECEGGSKWGGKQKEKVVVQENLVDRKEDRRERERVECSLEWQKGEREQS